MPETAGQAGVQWTFPDGICLGELSIQRDGRWHPAGPARGVVYTRHEPLMLEVDPGAVGALVPGALPPNLHTLRVNGAPLLGAHFRAIAEATGLVSLSLAGSRFAQDDLALLAATPTLSFLDLSHTGLNDAGCDLLATSLPQLRGLVVSHTAVESRGATGLARLPRLESLHFRGTAIDDAGFDALLGQGRLREITPCELLTDRSWYALGRLPGLANLFLNGVDISPDVAGSFYELRQLQVLALGAGAGDEVLERLNLVQSLGMAWAESPHLTHRGLRGLRGAGKLHTLVWQGRAFGGPEVEALHSHPELARLSITRADFPLDCFDALSYCKGLREIRLACPAMVDDMTGVLAPLRHLRVLQLFGTGLTAEGLQRLRALLPETEILLGAGPTRGGVSTAPASQRFIWGRLWTRPVGCPAETPWQWHDPQAPTPEGHELSYRASGIKLEDFPALAALDPETHAEWRIDACTLPAGVAPLLARFTGLRTLDAPELHASAEAWHGIARLPALTRLHIPAASLKGIDFAELLKDAFPALEYLNLRDTVVGDAVLATAATHTHLRELDVVRTAVSPCAVAEFRTARPEVTLHADPHGA